MPPDSQKQGEAQEASVRARLSSQGYTQPYGLSDDEIRKGLGMRGKCADFLGYHPQLDEWLIPESKGSDMDAAYEQLNNTMKGLLAKQSVARGKIVLQVHISSQNYTFLSRDGMA